MVSIISIEYVIDQRILASDNVETHAVDKSYIWMEQQILIMM
ncbi:hypothetical protein [uncultured Clostridium sp.]|nr:hypothetical protein [uncultured Clostridium sp.]